MTKHTGERYHIDTPIPSDPTRYEPESARVLRTIGVVLLVFTIVALFAMLALR